MTRDLPVLVASGTCLQQYQILQLRSLDLYIGGRSWLSSNAKFNEMQELRGIQEEDL